MNGVYAGDTKMVLCNSVISLEVINEFWNLYKLPDFKKKKALTLIMDTEIYFQNRKATPKRPTKAQK